MRFLSLVVRIEKPDTLQEFLMHYFWQGIEHFYLIGNLVVQGTLAEKVTVIRPTDDPQQAFDRIRQETEWLVIVDACDFWFGKYEILSQALRRVPQFVNVIYTHWFHFDEGENKTEMRKRSVHRHPSRAAYECRSIVRCNRVLRLMPSYHHMAPQSGLALIDDQTLQINRYGQRMGEDYVEDTSLVTLLSNQALPKPAPIDGKTCAMYVQAAAEVTRFMRGKVHVQFSWSDTMRALIIKPNKTGKMGIVAAVAEEPDASTLANLLAYVNDPS